MKAGDCLIRASIPTMALKQPVRFSAGEAMAVELMIRFQCRR
jgi:hypothetical protein